MKKLFFSLVVAMMSTTATFAQTSLVATLTHGDEVSMFYGTYALRDAYQAAVSGDVINLSGGTFQAVDINKAITLRGAGIDAASPSHITGGSTFNIPTEDSGRLSMEGVWYTGGLYFRGSFTNAQFQKCRFGNISFDSSANISKTLFANCRIHSIFEIYGSNSVQFVNCYVNNPRITDDRSSAVFVNCVIKPYGGYDFSSIGDSQLLNCILCMTENYSGYYLPSTTSATNCVLVGFNPDNIFSRNQANTGCVSGVSFEDMFTNYTGNNEDSQTFELTSTAQTTYLGTDGTQVGLYGGLLPYTSTPSYPQITTMNVANKTTADGKLSVEIEVSAAQ